MFLITYKQPLHFALASNPVFVGPDTLTHVGPGHTLAAVFVTEEEALDAVLVNGLSGRVELLEVDDSSYIEYLKVETGSLN